MLLGNASLNILLLYFFLDFIQGSTGIACIKHLSNRNLETLRILLKDKSVAVLARDIAIVQAKETITQGSEVGGHPQRLTTSIYNNDKSAGTKGRNED